MNVLFISNFVKTYSLVFQNELETLCRLGHKVTWAANFDGFIGNISTDIPFDVINVPMRSNPLNRKNLTAYKILSKNIKSNQYDAIICTTPIGGVIGRLLGKKHKTKIVIYSAHGFLFFKGFGFFKSLLFKTVERVLAHYTNHIITITKEDYNNALDFKLKKNGLVHYIHGAGIKNNNLPSIAKKELRDSLGISEKDFVLCSAGALNKNKNNIVVIKAMRIIRDRSIKYLICGEGPKKQYLLKKVKQYRLTDSVLILGYKTNAIDYINASDLFVMPSFREGVPRSLLEAMDLGLPCIGSDVRGINELIDAPFGGVVCRPNSPKDFSRAIINFKKGSIDFEEISRRNRIEAEKYGNNVVVSELEVIYKTILK